MTDGARWLIVLGLSLGPAVSNGFARFAYGLILPAMRSDLGWTYAQAGWINTANAIGYLIGSLLALAAIARLGPRRLFIGGMWLTAAALILSALTRDFWMLTFWRAIAGVGGAPAFIAGGVIASALFGDDKRRGAMAIAVYFGGGGVGMVISGGALPFFVDGFGDDAWPLAWAFLGLAGAVCFIPSYLAAAAAPDPRRRRAEANQPLPTLAMAPALAAYFLFGLGYLVYVTFLVAWMRDGGAGPSLVAGTWVLMGAAVTLAAPFWAPLLSRAEGGLAIAATLTATGAGAALPMIWGGNAGILASAALFGASFFMAPTAVAAFGRRNLPEAQWGRSLSLMTVVFSVGQIIGPTAAGLVADVTGGPAAGLTAAAVVLLLGAAVGAVQRPLGARPQAQAASASAP